MKCPHCGRPDTRVIDSRPVEDGTSLRRRRQCDFCNTRFTTHERVLTTPLIVAKGGGRREEFDPDKLRSGVMKACNKRPIPADAIAALVADVEAALRQEPGNEVSSARIGELVMDSLYNLDQIAYVRFASVYQRFDDVRRFAQLLDRMSRRNRRRDSSKGEGDAAEPSVETNPGAETNE